MDDHALEQLLYDIESDRVERKSSLADRSKICQTICAFANDLPNHRLPGIIFIGVDDAGNCTNYAITDELLRTIADMRTSVYPFASLIVQKHSLGGCELAVILVAPSDTPPVRYDGRIWVRVGPRRAIATPDEERRLAEKRRALDMPFDIRPVRLATLEYLDLDLFQHNYLPAALPEDILAQNERSVEHQLVSMRFASAGDPIIPTTLGLLITSQQVRTFIPGAYIQFVRFDGTTMADLVKDQKEITGTLIEQLRTLDEVLQAHTTVTADLTTTQETRTYDYPRVAIQQVVRNAVMHRTYESTHAPVRIYWFNDRIEINSPGGPFGQVNRDNFGQPGITDYRNPHLAEAMKYLGYVQRFGVGIAITYQEMQNNGNPPPEFIVSDVQVLVILRRHP